MQSDIFETAANNISSFTIKGMFFPKLQGMTEGTSLSFRVDF
jgi:hypothetical protein